MCETEHCALRSAVAQSWDLWENLYTYTCICIYQDHLVVYSHMCTYTCTYMIYTHEYTYTTVLRSHDGSGNTMALAITQVKCTTLHHTHTHKHKLVDHNVHTHRKAISIFMNCAVLLRCTTWVHYSSHMTAIALLLIRAKVRINESF